MTRTSWILAACIALVSHAGAWAASDRSTIERQTRFGTVVGVDDSATTGTYAWKGVPFAKPPIGALRWKAPVDPDAWKSPQADAAVRQRLRAVRPHLRPGRQQPLRLDHRHDAEPGGGQRGLPVPEHLAPARLADRSDGGLPGDRLRSRRQQRLRLHRRPGVRRRRAGAKAADAVVVTVNYRLGIFGFLNVPQLKTGADAQRGLGQLRAARHRQGAAVRPPRHRQVRRQPDAT